MYDHTTGTHVVIVLNDQLKRGVDFKGEAIMLVFKQFRDTTEAS